MLEYLLIFAKGGAILWSWHLVGAILQGNPIDVLVRECLLQERIGENSFKYKPDNGAQYTMKWTFHNGLDLVFVAVFQRAMSLPYLDKLLERVKASFAEVYKPDIYDYPEYDKTFQKLLNTFEKSTVPTVSKPHVNGKALSSSEHGAIANGTAQRRESSSGDDDGDARATNGVANGGVSSGAEDTHAPYTSHDSGISTESDNDTHAKADAQGDAAFNAAALKQKSAGRGRGLARNRSKPPKQAAKSSSINKSKTGRTWEEKHNVEELDCSVRTNESERYSADREAVAYTAASRVDAADDVFSDDDDDDAFALNGDNGAAATGAKKGWLASVVSSMALNITGTQALTADAIEPALSSIKKKLMERNVAAHVADSVCESVAASLVGKRLASFQGIYSMVKRAFEEGIMRILTPGRSIDVLAEIRTRRLQGKPYVIVFCGVNGVGKSTNLAKIAYWLKSNNLKVMIAGCDTFRSGAIEQLRTHTARLGVDLFERGYEKDAANVAYEAVKQCEKEKHDVLLVDTAGRMQDNEPLMRALANLIYKNNPNLVLFVGEALVGNDAVDQLTKFNQRLKELAPPTATNTRRARALDGIVLTKYDTIGDKVGAAVSMSYIAQVPIMFVGCGQMYHELDRLRVKDVVHKLLK